METKLCRMNSTTDSTTQQINESLDEPMYSIDSTNVQSQTSKLNSNTDLLDSSSLTSSATDTPFLTPPNHISQPNQLNQTNLSSNCSPTKTEIEPEKELDRLEDKLNGDFATDLEFGNRFTNSPLHNLLLPQATATSSLSSINNSNKLDNLDNKTHQNTLSLSCSPPIQNDTSLDNHSSLRNTDQLTSNLNDQLIASAKLSTDDFHKLSTDLSIKNDNELPSQDSLNDLELAEKLKEHLTKNRLKQDQLNEQMLNSNSSGDEQSEDGDDDCSEDCSSNEEDDSLNSNKKRSRGLDSHSCSKKRRKQSNPLRCNFESSKLNNQQLNLNLDLRQFNQLNQLSHLKQQSNSEHGAESNELFKNLENLENLKNQINQLNQLNQLNQFNQLNRLNETKNEQAKQQQQTEDEQEEGLIRKFPNALSSAANATARFFLSNHQTGNFQNQNQNQNDIKLNYTFYLAAAAAVATQSSIKGTKHSLSYCKSCCSPFLSTEHEKMYRQLEKQQTRQTASTQQDINEKTVFAQQLHNLAQKSKLMQELESVFSNNYELGQLPQRNALDAMQLIGQLCQLDGEEAKVYQQQLTSLINSNLLNTNNTNNQTLNPLSAILAGRIFNPDAYCELCNKNFCNKYFLRTHRANKHGVQDQQSVNENKCISPPNAMLNTGRKSLSPKRDQNQHQLQYSEIFNAIASSEQQKQQQQQQQSADEINNTSNNSTAINNENQQQKDVRNQMSLQQILANANQLQQLSAVLQAESFANILRNSIVSQPNSGQDLSNADLAQLLNSANANFIFTPERLREMGVVNPEAFCEICCKEFCNKYFLKTHKANKHNIQNEDDGNSSSCDSNVDQQDKLNKMSNNSEMCNLDDDALEPGQCPPTMNLATLLMINNLKQQQQQKNNFIQENANANQQSNKQTSSNKDDADLKSRNNSCHSCNLCTETFTSIYHLKIHHQYLHKIPFAKEDDGLRQPDLSSLEKLEQVNTDRNNNSNEEISNVQKESTDTIGGLDLSQQQQNEELIKFHQMIKGLQQNSNSDLETEFLKKVALIQKQQQLAAKLNEEQIYCDNCEKEFKSRTAFRHHTCTGSMNENRLADSPSSMFSNLSAQMTGTMLNNSTNSNLNYNALNGESESLVNQTVSANTNLNISSNGRDSLNNSTNPLLNNNSNQQRLSPANSNNTILAGLANSLPSNLPNDVTNSIFFSSTAGITLDPNNKQPKFVAGRNYCNLCSKELCNKYFMKTHMLKMHNINIDEDPVEAMSKSIVGGVMCDICQKELCSKYFLKVHKQNTHGIYEEGGMPIKNPQVTCSSDLLTSNNSAIQSGNVPGMQQQSNLSPNACLTNQNGLANQTTASAVNSLNPLLSVYETGLSKEQQQQLQQIQMQLKQQSQQLLNLKNGSNSSVNYPQQSNTPISFINNSNSNATSNLNTHQTVSPNSNNGRSMERNERETLCLQGIDPSDTNNRYFLQYTEICPHCKRRFKSIKWLKNHLQTEHPNLISSNLSSPNLSNTQNSNDKQTESNASSKIKCMFCAKLFSDQESYQSHVVNDHRNSLEEMILAQKIDYASNFGIDDPSIGECKAQTTKFAEQLRSLQQQSTPSDKNEALINKLLNQKNLSKQSPTKNEECSEEKLVNNLKNDCNELENDDQSDLDEEEDDEKATLEEQQKKQNSNLSNILQMIQKEQQSEEDEEMLSDDLSDEDRFAAMLNNNAQLQQLLLSNNSSTNSNNNNTQPSTSNSLMNNSKVLNLYEELIGQSNQQQDDYERFAKAIQQHQLIQQLEQEEKLNKLNQLQNNNSLRKRNNSIYTKLYQCNICEYNTRWLSNLYAHEKRRHNTCTSSQGNLKVITVRRDIPSPTSSSAPNRLSNTQMNLNSLLMGLENNSNQQQQPQKPPHNSSSNQASSLPSNCMNDDILNQLNDFNNNNFVNLLQQQDSSKPTRPIKERTASGDGQFVCTICQRSYRHKHSLQRHLVCHRNQENNNSSLNNKIGLNQDQNVHSLNFKAEQHASAQSPSNDLNGNLFTPPSNGTSTPSFLNNTGRSSVDSVKSGEHNLKQQQMFSQEILESLISSPNSSILNNLIGNTAVHSPNNKTNYSSSPANDTPAMFSV